MEKKVSYMFFIDKLNYENLITAQFTLDDISKIQDLNDTNISLLTKGIIINLNKQLTKLLYNSNLASFYYENSLLLNDKEKLYIEDNFKFNMLYKNSNNACNIDKKYYEIIILADNTILVIVEEGFLAFMIESKDNLLKFILDCLYYQYKFNYFLDSLMKTYISLKINDMYFNLIKSKFS